jgi:hypothetical protein
VLEVMAVALVVLMVLTGIGQLRRGGGSVTVGLAAVVFPITWMVWYLVDLSSTGEDAVPPTSQARHRPCELS